MDGEMRVRRVCGILVLLFVLFLPYQSKAEVLLANTHAANGSTKLDLNIRITASSLTLLQKIQNLRLFGDTGQTISASFGWYLGNARTVTGVEVGSSGAYNFDLSTLTMPPLDGANNYYMELRGITATGGTGAGIYTVSSADQSSTANATGYTLTGYNTVPIQFEMTTAVPEPGSLVLAGIAAGLGGAGTWWRKRRERIRGLVIGEGQRKS